MTKKKNPLQPVILVVEDDRSVAAIVSYTLSKEGYKLYTVDCAEDAEAYALSKKPDLIIIDWVLYTHDDDNVANSDGVILCRKLRARPETKNTPIIMLSSKDKEYDRVTGLNSGADDYVTKPFSSAELAARVKAVIRRIRPAFCEEVLEYRDIVLNITNSSVHRNGKRLNLSPIEFKLLLTFMSSPGKVHTRDDLIGRVWDSPGGVSERTVDVHITRLRRALLGASSDNVDVICTVRLTGYSLLV